MTLFDNLKANGALGDCRGPHRLRVAAILLERSGESRALSFAHSRPRGPPGAC
jgi:hypothetical protein